MRPVVSYHLGWSDERGRPVNNNCGKAIRPALVFVAAEAAGADPHSAIPGAVSVELVHNFSLVHDDLMDRDEHRRHRPTVWALWGDAMALLAGDAMLSLAHEVLLDCDSPHVGAALRAISEATRELIRGQAADTAFESRTDVALDECLKMAEGKTAALMAASAEVGALLAGAPRSVREALVAYGRHIGLAFQLVDDLLGIWGRPEITGKPVYSDLRSRKKTLPVTWTVAHGGSAGRRLAAWLVDETGSQTASDDELAAVAELIECGGGRRWASAEARRHVTQGIDMVARIGIPDRPAAELQDLAHYIVDRQA
ncbi:e,e-farnesyl diphosphate synthase [Mycobacterium tuberculosis variant bovis B2 7505]|nr:e,e-farnesyl diphosphate synthase [Mycobacterium tuberculosis variant bovis B2 7505]CKP71920.1 multifunctional geranylgeranyl pyrophosphate synthetase: dimethylallyltransferase + geranyltranstransferase + farnesyltranstransferase [Mycobacterium tuberculosis]